MSTQHSQNKNTIKKIKLDDADKDVGSVAEHKRFAILKYCKENGIEKYQLDVTSISNELYELGVCYCFLTSSISIILKLYEIFYMLVIDEINVVIITYKHIHKVIFKKVYIQNSVLVDFK